MNMKASDVFKNTGNAFRTGVTPAEVRVQCSAGLILDLGKIIQSLKSENYKTVRGAETGHIT
jgi:hypothetical protein